jgi:hypothetical protein
MVVTRETTATTTRKNGMFAFPFPSSDTITKELRTFMEYYSVERHQSSYFTHLAGGADQQPSSSSSSSSSSPAVSTISIAFSPDDGQTMNGINTWGSYNQNHRLFLWCVVTNFRGTSTDTVDCQVPSDQSTHNCIGLLRPSGQIVELAHQAMPANDTAGIRHHILEFPSNRTCIGNCEWYMTAFLKFNKYQFRNNQHRNNNNDDNNVDS